MTYFLDTSALVKIYHREDGTDDLLQIYKSQEEIAISELAKIEFYSTIYRKYREREISIETLRDLLEKFNADTEERFDIFIFSSSLTELAKELFSSHGESRGIRSLDSLQLAFFRFYCVPEDTFVCSDIKLIKTAQKEDINVMIV